MSHPVNAFDPLLSGLAHYKNRHVQGVADRIDRGAEDQILDAAVSMRSHDEQIRVDFAGVV